MPKYEELPAFTENKFKEGDLCMCYDSSKISNLIYIVEKVIKEYVVLRCDGIRGDYDNLEIHFSCCRKLEKVGPKEFWITKKRYVDIYGVVKQYAYEKRPLPGTEEDFIRVREFLGDEE